MKLEAEIVFIPKNENTEIASIEIPNPSKYSDTASLNNVYIGGKPFIMGVSKLGYGDRFWKKYDGIIDVIPTKYDGDTTGVRYYGETAIDQPYTITIRGKNINNIVLRFDQVARQWATELSIDGKKYENDDPQFVWVGDYSNSHTIQILKWNTPGYPVRITSITNGLTMLFDERNLKKLVRSDQMTREEERPYFGLIGQYGALEIFDLDSEIRDLAELRLLQPKQLVTIRLGGKIVGKLLTDKWQYDIEQNIAKVTLVDITNALQEKRIQTFASSTPMTAKQLLDYTLKQANIKAILDENMLDKIIISVPFFKSNITYFEALSNIASLDGMAVYVGEEGALVFRRII